MLFSHSACPTLCDPTDCSMTGSAALHCLPELLKLTFIKLVMPSNHLILCDPLLLLPSLFPSIRVFSNENFFLHINSIFFISKFILEFTNESSVSKVFLYVSVCEGEGVGKFLYEFGFFSYIVTLYLLELISVICKFQKLDSAFTFLILLM